MTCNLLLLLLLASLIVTASALVAGSWTVGTTGLELRISISSLKGAWDAEVLLADNSTVLDVTGRPWSTTTPVRISVSLLEPIGDILPLIPYGDPLLNAFEVWRDATSIQCSSAQHISNQVCCGGLGAYVVRTLGRNATLYQPYKLASASQRIIAGVARVQAQQGTRVASLNVQNGKGVVTGPFMTASMTATQVTAVSDQLLIMGTDGSVFWAPAAAIGTAARRIGVTDENWRALAAACVSSATSPMGSNSTDQWSSFRDQTLSSVCTAAEAVATIETGSGIAVRFEGCAGQSTAVVLLRLDAHAFKLVRRFADPIITDAGLLIGPDSPSNGGVIFVDVANRGAAGVVSVAISQCCGNGGVCDGFSADDPVSGWLDTAAALRFKLAFLVVGGKGDVAYCIAELWQAGLKEGSTRVALGVESNDGGHVSDGGGPIWNGPISIPATAFTLNDTCSDSMRCGCGATLLDGGCQLVSPSGTNATGELLCGEHGKAAEGRCVCDDGWATLEDQPSLHFAWCTQAAGPKDDTKLKHYNTSLSKIFIIVPVLLSLCCCCCCGYICVTLGCKIRRCCRRGKEKKQKERHMQSRAKGVAIAVP